MIDIDDDAEPRRLPLGHARCPRRPRQWRRIARIRPLGPAQPSTSAAGGVRVGLDQTPRAQHFRGLAKLLETHKLGVARIAILQDLAIPWTPFWRAKEIYLGLAALGLATPGATTCNPGITRSLTLA